MWSALETKHKFALAYKFQKIQSTLQNKGNDRTELNGKIKSFTTESDLLLSTCTL